MSPDDIGLVRSMGLEPIRQRHTPLKRACLPVPALPHISFLSTVAIISFNHIHVKKVNVWPGDNSLH